MTLAVGSQTQYNETGGLGRVMEEEFMHVANACTHSSVHIRECAQRFIYILDTGFEGGLS